MLPIFFVLLSVLNAGDAESAGEPQRLVIDSARPFSLQIESPVWNRSKTAIDQGWILLRDEKSDSIVPVELTETEANSNVFRAQVQNPWGTSQRAAIPEIYVPHQKFKPDQDFRSQDSQKKLKREIQQLARRPFFLDPFEGQQITIYHSKDAAFDDFARTMRMQSEKREQRESAERTRQLMEKEKAKALEKERLKQIASERAALDKAQELKRAEQLRKMKELDLAAQEKRRKEARAFAEKGLAFYREKNFVDAEKMFEKAPN